jgi:hypothetical protein
MMARGSRQRLSIHGIFTCGLNIETCGLDRFGSVCIAQGREGAHGMQKVCSVLGRYPLPVQGTVCRHGFVRKCDASALMETDSLYLHVDKSQLLEPVLS